MLVGAVLKLQEQMDNVGGAWEMALVAILNWKCA